MKTLFALLFLALGLTGFAQNGAKFLYPPIIGGVTDSSARMHLRVDKFCAAEVELIPVAHEEGKNSPAYRQLIGENEWTGNAANTLYWPNLSPNTRYEYTVRLWLRPGVASDVRSGSFKTFPPAGQSANLAFGFGSCIEHTKADSIFIQIAAHQPDFFLQIGDWTYPDWDSYPDTTRKKGNYFFTKNYQNVAVAYQTRYNTPNVEPVLSQIPIDYVPDDDDYMFDGNGRKGTAQWTRQGKNTLLWDSLFPPAVRNNAFQGYREFFPHYPLVNPNEGQFHSFQYGNAEFFFLDSRAARDSENAAFRKKGKRYKFLPPPGHTCLGKAQMDWLLNGLRKSKADWKFIITGTNFNKAYKKAFDLAMMVQRRNLNHTYNGMALAASMASMWIGYPEDQAKLLNACANEKIANVVILSGDAHASAIDDGTNAGFPEFMAGNLGVNNSKIPYYVQSRLGVTVWNRGGQGVYGNNNFNFCFGKVEVFGKDSLRMSIIDHRGQKLNQYTHLPGFVPQPVNLRKMNRVTGGAKFAGFFRLIGLGLKEARRKKKK